MNTLRRFTLLAAALAGALAGCASSPFHNETRDQQAQALARSVAQVDLLATVEALDKKFAALRQLELETLKARQATNRELEIAQAASPGPDGKGTVASRYVVLIDGRLERLTGAAAGSDALERAVDAEKAAFQQQAALRAFSAATQLPLASCAAAAELADAQGRLAAPALARLTPPQRAAAGPLFANLQQHCSVRPPALFAAIGQAQLLGEYEGKLAAAQARAQAFADALAGQKAQLAALVARFDAETQALAATPAEGTSSARLAAAADKLGQAVQALQQADALGVFGHALAEEELKSLDGVLHALASGNEDLAKLSVEQRRNVALIRLLPSLADEADQLLKQAARPRLAPLLLAKEQQRLAVEAYGARQALLARAVDLRRQQLEAAREEALALTRAKLVLLQPAPGVVVNTGQPLAAALADGADEGRRRTALFESLAQYFDHAQAARTRHEALELAANGLADEAVMQSSRSAARMWNSLLTHIAAILAEHHAAGIKPADLAEFLKGFGLVFIGQQAGK